MNRHQTLPAFDSHAAFYRETYADAVVETRGIGSFGASLVLADQGAGDWSDAPTPDLVICVLMRHSPAVKASVDMGAGRFTEVHRPGDFIVTPPNAGSAIEVRGAHSIVCVGLPYKSLRALAGNDESGLPANGDFGRLHTRVMRDTEVTEVATRLVQRVDRRQAGSTLWADGAVLQLASALLRLGALPPGPTTGVLAPWQLRRLTEYIEARLDQELSLIELAALIGLTPHHVCRAFQRSTGLPPLRWQMHRRIDKARELLEHTALPVIEVAARVGYGDPSAFAGAFRKLAGASPMQFRRDRRA